MIYFALDRLPIWGVFAVTVLVVLLSIRVGLLVGEHQRRRGADQSEPPTGPVGGAILGLLAFILAITFGGASSRFDARKQLLLEDVDAISTAVRRADLLPEPPRSESKALLKRYVDLRVEAVLRPQDTRGAMAESESLQRELWKRAIALARARRSPEIGGYIESLNHLMAVHMRRTTVALHYRIPSAIWVGLLILTVCAMGTVGYQFGAAGRANWVVSAGLAAAFASVIVIIAMLDRTTPGGIVVNQQPMLDLQRRLAGSVAGATATEAR
jgi:hypothetical protein